MTVFTMVAIVVVAGCVTGMVGDYLKTRRLEAKVAGAEQSPTIAALEERVRVLEKIVTDDRYEMRREINQLDDLATLQARAAPRG